MNKTREAEFKSKLRQIELCGKEALSLPVKSRERKMKEAGFWEGVYNLKHLLGTGPTIDEAIAELLTAYYQRKRNIAPQGFTEAILKGLQFLTSPEPIDLDALINAVKAFEKGGYDSWCFLKGYD
jgi:hypothetical protein